MTSDLRAYLASAQLAGMTPEQIAQELSVAGWTIEQMVRSLAVPAELPRVTAVPAAIDARDVVKSFGKVHAVQGVTLSVATGTVLALLGHNGAGKTTLVRMMAALLNPDSGSIRIAGHDSIRDAQSIRGTIGLTGQYAAVDEHLTGRENLELIGRLSQMSGAAAAARAHELLLQFNLLDAADRRTKTYSGGMRRRLDIAASLVNRPAVLFLDEPTTGLDPQSRNAMWDLIASLKASGTTILLTTQYLEEADRLADMIAVMDQGRIVAQGTAAQLKAEMGGDVVRVHLADGTEETHPAPNGAADLIAVVRKLDEAGTPVADIALTRPTLDDVFLSLTSNR